MYLSFLAEKLDFKIKSTLPPTDLAKKNIAILLRVDEMIVFILFHEIRDSVSCVSI